MDAALQTRCNTLYAALHANMVAVAGRSSLTVSVCGGIPYKDYEVMS